MFETFLDANRSQTDRKIRTKTVIASVHFDVVFTRASVFVDVPFCFRTGKVNFFQDQSISSGKDQGRLDQFNRQKDKQIDRQIGYIKFVDR